MNGDISLSVAKGPRGLCALAHTGLEPTQLADTGLAETGLAVRRSVYAGAPTWLRSATTMQVHPWTRVRCDSRAHLLFFCTGVICYEKFSNRFRSFFRRSCDHAIGIGCGTWRVRRHDSTRKRHCHRGSRWWRSGQCAVRRHFVYRCRCRSGWCDWPRGDKAEVVRATYKKKGVAA